MPRYRVCVEPGCPNYTDGHTRCDDCRSAHEKQRGTKLQRGYDAQYERNRRAPEYLNATTCETCGCTFTDENPKTAGHVDDLRNGGSNSDIFPQCRRCNYGWRRDA